MKYIKNTNKKDSNHLYKPAGGWGQPPSRLGCRRWDGGGKALIAALGQF